MSNHNPKQKPKLHSVLPSPNKFFQPTFGIWDSKKNLKPGIHCGFLARETIDLSSFAGKLYDAKGREYKAHFDFDIDTYIVPADMLMHVIVSYQQRVEGAFAVIRLLRTDTKQNGKK